MHVIKYAHNSVVDSCGYTNILQGRNCHKIYHMIAPAPLMQPWRIWVKLNASGP